MIEEREDSFVVVDANNQSDRLQVFASGLHVKFLSIERWNDQELRTMLYLKHEDAASLVRWLAPKVGLKVE
jgi:hypothetical protein